MNTIWLAILSAGEAESKDPVVLTFVLSWGFLDFARNDEPVHCLFRRSCLRISDTMTP